MTWEELTKVPFHFVSHIAMTDCHKSTYESKDGRLGFADIQPMKDDWPAGKSRRNWRIGGTWYRSKRKFLEALKDFEP